SCEPASVLRAAAKGRLELSAEVLAVGMAQQEFGQGTRIWGDIENFIRANTRVGASCHVADRVAAGLPSGDICRRQAAHQTGSIADVDIMELNILPGRHVRDAVGILL